MKNLLAIIVCALLLVGTANVYAVVTEDIVSPGIVESEIQNSETWQQLHSTTTHPDQQDGVDYCQNQTRIIIDDTATISARQVFEEKVQEVWSLSGDQTVCFDFQHPIALDTSLYMSRPPSSTVGSVTLVDMEFTRGAAVGPLIRIENTAGVSLHNLTISGNPLASSAAESCLYIADSRDVVVKGGRFEGCVFGVRISTSHDITLGAPHHLLMQAEGNFIGNNLSKGVYVENSQNVSLGSNDYQTNVTGDTFDYYNAVVLEESNLGVQPPQRTQEDESWALGASLYYKYMFANVSGRIQFYLIEGAQVRPLASCEVAADHVCSVLKVEMDCTKNALITAIYTSANGESSEFMAPDDCANWAEGPWVVPDAQYDIPTAEPAADSGDVVSGTAQMVGGEAGGGAASAPKMMCTMTPYVGGTYSPLVLLLLSTGLLGIVRFRCRK